MGKIHRNRLYSKSRKLFKHQLVCIIFSQNLFLVQNPDSENLEHCMGVTGLMMLLLENPFQALFLIEPELVP